MLCALRHRPVTTAAAVARAWWCQVLHRINLCLSLAGDTCLCHASPETGRGQGQQKAEENKIIEDKTFGPKELERSKATQVYKDWH